MGKKQEMTLFRWLRRYWLIMFACLIAVYFPLQSVMMGMLEKRKEESIRNAIEIAENGIETSLEIVDSFLYESLYNGNTQTSSQLYNTLHEEKNPLQLGIAKTTLINYLKSVVSWSDMIDFMMVYTEREDEDIWLEAGAENNFVQRQEIKQYISDCIQTGEQEKLERYLVCSTTRGNAMLRLLKMEESYIVISVSERELIQLLRKADLSGSGIVFAAERNGQMIFSSQPMDKPVPPDGTDKYVAIRGKEYLKTGSLSQRTGYYFGVLTERSTILEDLWLFRVLFLLLWGVMLIIMPLSFFVVINNVEKPIGSFVSTMNRIAEGDLEQTAADNHRLTELRSLADTFNHMLRQIQKLKIEKYEVQLEAQKASMQYLQLQIKPHFYVNLLNIIYALAEQQDFGMIQKISHAVVCYSRYMFRDASELVELRREIEHVRYYMEIQQIRYNRSILCEIHVPEEIHSAQVPPFVIQSFVENSVKYALHANSVCKISISAETDGSKENLKLCIQDNGSGYSQDYLNQDWDRKGEAGHIGLTNVRQRLKLIFGDKAEIVLGNDGGAVARITMPYISVEDMDLED